jgi:regulator of protease activity HflC (stomatin/prohibitin superfamily)
VSTSNVLKLPKMGGSKALPGFLTAIGVVVGLFLVLWIGFCETVGPDDVAIKQVYLGPGKGVQEEVYGPGLHFIVPGYERLHRMPRDLQVLDFNSEELKISGPIGDDYRAAPAINIQTSDGYNVEVDITILYRISDPYRVVTKVGFGRAYEDKVVLKRSDTLLREHLGRMIAEDFFNDGVRMRASEVVRQELTTDLQEWGIQVWGVLVRAYDYDSGFQEKIEAKKIQDQRKFKEQAENRKELARGDMNEILAQLEAQISVVKQTGDNRVREIRADAERYFRERVAEGKKLVALAEADGDKWERQALEAAGASNVVGLKMADAMEGVEVIVISTTGSQGSNPLDLDSLLEGW